MPRSPGIPALASLARLVAAIGLKLPRESAVVDAKSAASPTRDGVAVHDANNPDAALRGRPILGLEILSGFKAAPGGGWVCSTRYAPRAGKRHPATLSLTADGRLQLEVKAGLLWKTVYWTR